MWIELAFAVFSLACYIAPFFIVERTHAADKDHN